MKHELPKGARNPCRLVENSNGGAQQLAISETTVKQHMSVLLTKLQCNNRCKLATQPCSLVVQLGWLPATQPKEKSRSVAVQSQSLGEKAGSTQSARGLQLRNESLLLSDVPTQAAFIEYRNASLRCSTDSCSTR